MPYSAILGFRIQRKYRNIHKKYTYINRIFVMEDVTPLSDAYILDIITAHLSSAGIHQTIMFLVALAYMGETRRCRIKVCIM